MTRNSVVYRNEAATHAVYQPNAEVELYIPVMVQLSPGLPNGANELLVIPATRPTFETLREAWEWHLETYKEAVQRQHMQVDQSSLAVLEAFRRQLGEDVRSKPLNGRTKLGKLIAH